MQPRRLAKRRVRPRARRRGRRRQRRQPRRPSPRGAARAWLGPPIFPAWTWWPPSARPRRLSKPPNGKPSPATRRPGARPQWTRMLRRLWRLPSARRRRQRPLRQPPSAIKKESLSSAGGVCRVRLPRPRRRARRRRLSGRRKTGPSVRLERVAPRRWLQLWGWPRPRVVSPWRGGAWNLSSLTLAAPTPCSRRLWASSGTAGVSKPW